MAQPAWALTGITIDPVVPGQLSLTAAWTTATPTATDRVIAKAYESGSTTVAATCQKFAALGPQNCVLKGLKANQIYDVTVEVRSNANVEVVPAAQASPGVPDDGLRTPLPPGAPTNVVADATGVSGEVEVFWEADHSADAVVSGFTATTVEDPTKKCTTANATVDSCKITGLTNNTPYTVTVVATGANGTGESVASAVSNSVTPGIKPAPPTDVMAWANSGTSAEVHWTASATDASAINSYTVTAYTLDNNPVGGLTCVPVVVPGNANLVGCPTSSSLTPGVEYYFEVTATGTNGQTSDAAKSDNILPTLPPAAPTDGEVEVGDGELIVSWTAPTSTPATIGRYRVIGYSPTPDAVSPVECTTTNSTETSCTLTGLTNDAAYTLGVYAVSAAGTGTLSAPLPLVGPYTPAATPKPAAPTGVELDATDSTIVVTWDAPAAAAADAPVTVTHYAVTAEPGDKTCATVNATVYTCTLTGLTPETEYTVTVVAKGANADSVGATETVTTLPAPGGGDGPGGEPTGPIVVDKDGNARIFVRGGAPKFELWTAIKSGDGDWTNWETLGFPLYSEPVAVKNTDGTLQVFTLDGNGYLTYKRENANGGFGDWTRVSTTVSLANIVLATNADGKAVVFGRSGNSLVYAVQTTDPATWTWTNLGTPISGVPTVTTTADGRLEVFVTGYQGAVYRRTQKAVNVSAVETDWSAWERVAPSMSASLFM